MGSAHRAVATNKQGTRSRSRNRCFRGALFEMGDVEGDKDREGRDVDKIIVPRLTKEHTNMVFGVTEPALTRKKENVLHMASAEV